MELHLIKPNLQLEKCAILFQKMQVHVTIVLCAGSEYVDLDLQSNDDNCFTVKPKELLLRTGEEQEVVVTFTAQSNRKYKEWYVCFFTVTMWQST